MSRRRELLREKPTSTGRPSASRTSSLRTSSRFWATVLPKPMPGSRQIRSSGMPCATAKASRSSRNEATSAATSPYRGSACIVRGSPCMCMRQRYAPAPATTPASSGSPRRAVTSLTRIAPRSSAARATAAFDVSIEIGRSPPRRSRTGTTRRSSSSAETPSEPGRVDSPPTSTIAAPSAIIRFAAVDCDRRVEVDAAVRERVGRDVDDAHHRRPRKALLDRDHAGN